jgi:hypothetical protein
MQQVKKPETPPQEAQREQVWGSRQRKCDV